MPNLDYDPQNPTDLLGQPIAEGDYVAWGSTWGRSAALCVAVIEKIRFVCAPPSGYGTRVECPRAQAEEYTLRLRPIRTTGDVTWIDKRTGETVTWQRSENDILCEPDRYEGKTKNVLLVQNIVKLDPDAVEAAMAALTEKARMAA